MTANEWLGVMKQAQDFPKGMEKLIVKYGEMLIAEHESKVKKLTIPDVIFWQRFDQVKPQGDAEYLVCNTDGIIRVSYFDGINWGYLSTVKENITHWSILPQVPVI